MGADLDHPRTDVRAWPRRTMDVYEALYTTRAMRRVRPDPIPYPVQARILDAAIRAPSGGKAQAGPFFLAADPASTRGRGRWTGAAPARCGPPPYPRRR